MKITLLATILSIYSITSEMDMEPAKESPIDKKGNGYTCGKAIYLWADKWTFSYYDAHGREFLHYYQHPQTFPSEELARENMATFVWGINQ